VVRRPFRKKKRCKNCIRHLKNEKYTHTCLCLLFDFKQEVGELVISITYCPSIIILENTLILFGYSNFNHRYVSPIHLHGPLGVGNFTKVVRVCADCLWSGPRLSKLWETQTYFVVTPWSVFLTSVLTHAAVFRMFPVFYLNSCGSPADIKHGMISFVLSSLLLCEI
jgi:hypothetical protein